jgi:hypothetical protein
MLGSFASDVTGVSQDLFPPWNARWPNLLADLREA